MYPTLPSCVAVLLWKSENSFDFESENSFDLKIKKVKNF